MKPRILLPTILMATMLAGGASLALAERDPWGGGPGHCGKSEDQSERLEHRMARMTEVLDLNEQQQEQIKQLMTAQFEQTQDLQGQLRQNRDALRQQLHGVDFDEQSFRAMAGKQAGLKTEMLVSRAKLKLQINALLSPEQQQKAEKLLQLRENRRHGRHGFDL